MADPPHAQVAANVLEDKNGNLVITDVARAVFVKRTKDALINGELGLPFPCGEKLQTLDAAKDLDLDDRDKFPDFHNFWIDGLYTGIAKAINTVPSQFMIPIFDPLALAIALKLPAPKLSFPSVTMSLAAPIPLALKLIGIKPLDLPLKIPEMLKLINIEPPKIPALDIKFPDINLVYPWGAFQIQAMLNLAIPLGFAKLLLNLATPSFWAPLSFPALFELGCKTFTDSISAPFSTATDADGETVTPPLTGLAAARALASVTSDCAIFAATGCVVGAGFIVQKEAEMQGYVPRAAKEDTTLIAEGAMNGLSAFEPDETTDGARWVFRDSTRNTFFGDPFVVDYLYELSAHMKTKSTTFEVPDYIVEVGNITGKDDDHGWRWSKWSTKRSNGKIISSHFGSAFDFAYPLRSGNSRISGMNPKAKAITGEAEGAPGTSPYLPSPLSPLKAEKYDFEVMHEIFTWSISHVRELISSNKITPKNIYAKHNLVVGDVFISVTLGEQVFSFYKDWLKTNGKSLPSGPIWDPNKVHEDHLHFRFARTRSDSGNPESPNQDIRYLIPWRIEGKYPNDRGIEEAKSPPNPEDGSTITVVV
jgi:hypothetical protein